MATHSEWKEWLYCILLLHYSRVQFAKGGNGRRERLAFIYPGMQRLVPLSVGRSGGILTTFRGAGIQAELNSCNLPSSGAWGLDRYAFGSVLLPLSVSFFLYLCPPFVCNEERPPPSVVPTSGLSHLRRWTYPSLWA